MDKVKECFDAYMQIETETKKERERFRTTPTGD